MAIVKDQLRQIISENDINSVGDIYSLFKESFKDMLQELLEAELDATLGYEKHNKPESDSDNKRNGYSSKTVKSQYGTLDLDITYDRVQSYVDSTTMEYYYTKLSPVEVMITSNIISNPHSVSGQMYLEARAKLASERDALQDKLLSDLVVGGGSVALSAINPLAGAGVAFVKALAENNRADAAVAFNNGGKSILYDSKDPGSIGAAGVVTNTTKAFINYNANYSKITAAMNQEDKKMLQVGFIKAGYIT